MDRILAMIPLKDGHAFKSEVLRGLCKQTVPVDIMAVSRPKSERHRNIPAGYISMSECRNIAKEEGLEQYNSEYFLLLNRDVVLKRDTDIEDMINFLQFNRDFGAVAINTRKKEIRLLVDNTHTDIACMVIRRSILEKITFHNEKHCNCRCVCGYIRSNGLSVGYIDHRKCPEI